MAILEAVRMASAREEDSITVFSDSKSVLLSLDNANGFYGASFLCLAIKNEILKCVEKGKTIKLYWIPAHSHIKGNEIADINAKEATRCGRPSHINIPAKDLKMKWKEIMRNDFKKWCKIQFEEKGKGAYYYEHFYNIGNKVWFDKVSLNRKEIVMINRLRSGHNSLRDSLYKCHIVGDPWCECGVREDIDHVLWQCRRFDRQRLIFIKKITKLCGHLPQSSEVIIESSNRSVQFALAKFLNDMKIDI